MGDEITYCTKGGKIMGYLKIFQVDAFTNRPFRGNPAGVCILQTSADEAWMQKMASEMNLRHKACRDSERG